jgi:hemoglobin
VSGSTETASFYARIGGEAALAAFVERFYDVMASDPEVQRIWRLHPPDIGELKAKLVAFLSGFVGGPTLYPQRYGPPFMRARHLHVPIGIEERDMWLKCARAALDAAIADPEARAEFGAKLAAFANHMRNMARSDTEAGAPRGP